MQIAPSQPITHSPMITWDPLPQDFVLPDDPVDNISQPLLAAALRESLELWGIVTPETLIATNFGICATVDSKTVVKAPDWVYVPQAPPLPEHQTRRSYTPNLEGELPLIVMEFLSDTEGSEYSVKPNYPYGKWWFYERILQVPHYFIFHPEAGTLEHYQLIQKRYEAQPPNSEGLHWIPAMDLSLGVWQGPKADRSGYWLRWWEPNGQLLPWGIEKVGQERQRAEQERQRAEQERQRAEQERQRAEQEQQKAQALMAQLQALGIEPNLPDASNLPVDG
jgi:hypothetical protein